MACYVSSTKLLFQSPYGDYLVRNATELNPVIVYVIKMFQSPYGDYLVRNQADPETKAFMRVSVPLRGLLS